MAGGATWAVLPGSALSVPLGVAVAAVVPGTAAATDALPTRRR